MRAEPESTRVLPATREAEAKGSLSIGFKIIPRSITRLCLKRKSDT